MAQTGLPFRSEASHIREEKTGREPAASACILSEKKAKEVFTRTEGSWVIGADTIVVGHASSEIACLENETTEKILGKPKDHEEARRMLQLLSGREHGVITGFCILNPSGETSHLEAVTTRVLIKELTEQEIEDYIKTKEPFGKAGSYAIQGIGSFMVKSISGSYTNVVGLPIYALIKALVTVRALKSYPAPPP